MKISRKAELTALFYHFEKLSILFLSKLVTTNFPTHSKASIDLGHRCNKDWEIDLKNRMRYVSVFHFRNMFILPPVNGAKKLNLN